MDKPISIVKLKAYDPEWKAEFEYEKNRILNVIGDQILGIEHIGSTSIEGLKAKPIIDILIGVRDLSGVSTFIKPLEEIELEYVPKPELTDKRFFRKGLWGRGTVHLHICERNSREWVEKLLFRDFLRKHPEIALEYATLKSELAAKYKYDRPTYTQKKDPFIKDIIEKAKREQMGERLF